MACGVLWSLGSLTFLPRLGGTPASPSARALLCAAGREEWLLWADRGPRPRQSVSQEPGAMSQGRLAYLLRSQR